MIVAYCQYLATPDDGGFFVGDRLDHVDPVIAPFRGLEQCVRVLLDDVVRSDDILVRDRRC